MTSVVSVRHLFGPGLCLPLLGHLDPSGIAGMDLTCAGSRTLWGT